MKKVVVFGAGKSATVLIDYFKEVTIVKEFAVIVADYDLAVVQEKVGAHYWVQAVQIDIKNDEARRELVQSADVVVSLMPPALHYLIALDCITFKKHFLTASYIDDTIQKHADEIKNNDVLFLFEMGLDPGIDHMSAMKLIHSIQSEGGKITSFTSHCGGLVSPESDDNPWHYKISWNPRNVVLAGKAGAIYRENNIIVQQDYSNLFNNKKLVTTPEDGNWAYYPNRNSLSYIPLYGLESAESFVRTTLRHPDFMTGWQEVVQLKLTDEERAYQTDGMSLSKFFQTHFIQHQLSGWLQQVVQKLNTIKNHIEELIQLPGEGDAMVRAFSFNDANNEEYEYVTKSEAIDNCMKRIHSINKGLEQLFYLGMDDENTFINKGICSAADVLQFIIENKWKLYPADKDMIIMKHEIEYLLQDKKHLVESTLVVKGEDSLRTAMAKTVSLPLGIATVLILENKIQLKGLHIPILSEIYEPVLEQLAEYNVKFTEVDRVI